MNVDTAMTLGSPAPRRALATGTRSLSAEGQKGGANKVGLNIRNQARLRMHEERDASQMAWRSSKRLSFYRNIEKQAETLRALENSQTFTATKQ